MSSYAEHTILRRAISHTAYLPENGALQNLLPHTKPYRTLGDRIFTCAETYVTNMRAEPKDTGVEGFIRQFGLGTKEGVAILCLAEALLRIPDRDTADALISDKLSTAQWQKHLKEDTSLFVNASTYGLMLSGEIIKLGILQQNGVKQTLGKLVSSMGEPVVRAALKKAMQLLGGQFVMGRTIKEALKQSRKRTKEGYGFSFDMLGEGARTQKQADTYYVAYEQAISALGADSELHSALRPSISVKLSALHPRLEWLKRECVIEELVPKVKALLLQAMKHNILVSIDAEESRRFDLTLDLLETILLDEALAGYDGIGVVLQAYHKRALPTLDFLSALARKRGARIPIRLVKGAYWDAEIKEAQILGLRNYPVFTRKSHTDVSYLACAKIIFERMDHFYPQFATHNALTVASLMTLADATNIPPEDFEFQRLYGMGETFYEQVVGTRPCRIYAPVGAYDALLPYLIRRLLENGASSSFVNLVVDESEPIGTLLKSPVEKAQGNLASQQPKAIPNPEDIYGNRKNPHGISPGNASEMNALQQELTKLRQRHWLATPIINGITIEQNVARNITAPHNLTITVGDVIEASEADTHAALDAAALAFPEWNTTPMEKRAAALEKMANLLEAERSATLSLLQREGGKTIMDAIAEHREAVDFCRYYAQEARKFISGDRLPGPTGEHNRLHLEGRGVAVCISPWNFPLAIFLGQVAAALVTGNSVIAKPAGQTPLIAAFTVQLLHQAGIPTSVLHFLPGPGRTLGHILTSDPRVAVVVFTGSTATAQTIQRTLTERRNTPLPRLIAETGGLNAMIVDSTALREQAVDDIILSAFGSAGQRCSALRTLYVQQDCADEIVAMLKGAMEELQIGNPEDFTTDIGPVIDEAAQKHLHHVAAARADHCLAHAPVPDNLPGHFITPQLFSLQRNEVLDSEHFGPLLFLKTFDGERLDTVIDEINGTGFGLTFGLHTRIANRMSTIAQRVRAGNIYINRGMTGAVVGVHPFGGMGFSGTGPKAGGPHYLTAFTTEKTISNNIAAIGGNLELLT